MWDLGEAEDLLINRALGDASRRARRRQELTALAPAERAADASEIAAVDGREELMDALATLPPRQRAVLVLRYFLDLPEAEVAAAMRCSPGTVKSTASRGLARLEQAMRPNNETRSIPT